MRRLIALLLLTFALRLEADDVPYFVTLSDTAAAVDALNEAESIAATYGGVVHRRDGETTFVITVSKARAEMMARDPRVRGIAPVARGPVATMSLDWSSGVPYTYDGSGNVASIGSDAYVYDGVSRVVQATTGGLTQTYSYDRAGNRTGCVQDGVLCQQLPVNSDNNRLMGPLHDPSGNVLSLDGHMLTYDALSMMTRNAWGDEAREYVYTADDERLAVYRVGAWWKWTVRGLDHKVLREFTSTNGPTAPGSANFQWVSDSIWRNGLLLATRQTLNNTTQTYAYHLDHLGTPRVVSDANAIIRGVHDYHPFGVEVSTTSITEPAASAFRFTGHERDSEDTNPLDYMHARFYGGGVGRFLSVDPGRDWDPKQPQSWNMYVYARNNPVRFTDPDGRAIETPWDGLNVGIGLASFAANLSAGNIGGAAVDAVGLVWDISATAAPGVPGGASSWIKATRLAANAKFGKAFENAVRGALDLSKNTERIGSATRTAAYRIPDAFAKGMLIEIKGVKELRLTDQVKDYLAAAAKKDQKVVIVVARHTNVNKAYEDLVKSGQVLIVRAEK